MKAFLPVLCLVVLGLTPRASAAITALGFISAPGAVGGGETRAFFEGDEGYSFVVTGHGHFFNFIVGSDNSPWGPDWNPSGGDSYYHMHVQMQPRYSAPFTVGLYTDLEMVPYADSDHPALSFYGNGSLGEKPGGEFTVLEVSYNGGGEMISFAADFIQYDGGDPERWNAGSVRFNSGIPLTIPEPQPTILALLFPLAALVRRRRGVQM